jgi:hypothetical protein
MNDLKRTPVWHKAIALGYLALLAIQLFVAQHWRIADFIPFKVWMLLCIVGFALCATAFRASSVTNWQLIVIYAAFIALGVCVVLH